MTTKEEVKRQYDKIRQMQPSFKHNPKTFPVKFKIKALRDNDWKWPDIMDFLSRGEESHQEYEARINAREEELKNQGKTVEEIDKILDQEFSYSDFDKTLNL